MCIPRRSANFPLVGRRGGAREGEGKMCGAALVRIASRIDSAMPYRHSIFALFRR